MKYGLKCFFFFLISSLYATVGAKTPSTINCDIQNGPCTQSLSATTVTFDIHPKPVKAMENLVFRLMFSGKVPSALPQIDLGMPGMKMGPNQIEMKATGQNVYEGTGVIVRCPSGKRIWKATVNAPGIGQAEFIFDVVY